MADRPLYPVSRRHLDVLTGPLGIWQHAAGSAPDGAFGYCVDDVARALTVDLLHRRELGWKAVSASAERSLTFLEDAFEPASGRFRNFRAQDGAWLEAGGSEDSQGRALLALGTTLADAPDDEVVARAGKLFVDALPAASRMTSPRAIASVMLGCASAMDGGLRREPQHMLEELSGRLGRAFTRVRLDPDWPWPEAELTYENALLPCALISAGSTLGDYELRRTGLRVLDWLIDVQITSKGVFSPVGSSGWWPRAGVRSRFDQQPIEATSTILAAEIAFHSTGDERYLRAIESAYGWFLGDNDLGVPLADPARGSCHDGLSPRGVNLNEGAESTLMWLTALEHVRVLRAEVSQPARAEARA